MKAVAYACLSGALTALPVQAQVYRLSASGTITASRLHDYTTNTDTAAPSGLMKIGDSFTFSALFDTRRAILTPLYDADPSVNIYYLPDAYVTIAAGSYASAFFPRFDISASVQLWNDHVVTTSLVVDSQSFEFSNYNYAGSYPYQLNSAPIRSESISLQSYDFTHLVRSSDLISELTPSSLPFSSNSLSYAFSTSDTAGRTYEGVFLTIGSLSYTLTAVPEPGTWAMMVIAFGLVGSSMRRRQRIRVSPA